MAGYIDGFLNIEQKLHSCDESYLVVMYYTFIYCAGFDLQIFFKDFCDYAQRDIKVKSGLLVRGGRCFLFLFSGSYFIQLKLFLP